MHLMDAHNAPLFLLMLCLPLLGVGQKVGIATNSPYLAKLDVPAIAGAGATSAVFGTGGLGISVQRNWPTIGFNQYRDEITPGSQGRYMHNGFAAIQYIDPNIGMLVFNLFPSGTAGSYTPGGIFPLVVAANGNTAIGTTETLASLTIARGQATGGTLAIQSDQLKSTFNSGSFEHTTINAGTATGVLRIGPNAPVVLIGQSSARVGINMRGETPARTLEIRHKNNYSLGPAFTLEDGRLRRWALHDGDGSLTLLYNQKIKGYFGFNGGYYSPSDSSLKYEVNPLRSVLKQVRQLQPVRYALKANNEECKKDIGFLAQDIAKWFPELIMQTPYRNSQGLEIPDAYTMNYAGLGVIAIKALQEQHEQILYLMKVKEELKQKLAILQQNLGN